MGDGFEATAELAGMDYFHALPDCIIHKILSLLPKISRDAGRTSVLSKRWNLLWSTYPYLEYHPSYSCHVQKQLQLQPHNHKKNFLNFLESSIQPRLQKHECIYKFQMHIDFPDLEMLTPLMDRWISMAMGKDVVEFDLYTFYNSISSRKVSIWYSVPQAVLMSETLKSLQLYGCKLEGKLDIKLPCLKKLELYEICGLDMDMFGNLIRGCPLVEHLFLVCCNELKSVTVTGVPQLKDATFSNCYRLRSIEIKVPNLHEFAFDIPLDEKTASVDERNGVPNIDLSSCSNLKRLRFSGVKMSFQSLMSFLLNAEVLVLQQCYSSEHVALPVQKFKKFVFHDCCNFSLSYNSDIRRNPGVSFKSMNPLQEIHLQVSLKYKDLRWWSSWKVFLANVFHGNLKVALYNPHNRAIIIHDNLHDVFLSSIFKDNTLWNNTSVCISSRSYLDILDVILWENQSTSLSVVSTHSSKLMKSLSWKPLRVQTTFRRKQFWHRFCGFEKTYSQPVQFSKDDPFRIFVKEHSVGDYHTTTFKMKWTATRMVRHIPYQTNRDLDFSLTNLYFY